MNSLKKGEGVPLLNIEGGPRILLLNFEGGPGVLLLNFRGVPGPGVLVPLLQHAVYLRPFGNLGIGISASASALKSALASAL